MTKGVLEDDRTAAAVKSERGAATFDDDQVVSTSRHPGDAVRVVVGAAVLSISLLAVQRDRLTTFETDLFRLVNDLPAGASAVLGPVMQLGNVLSAPALGLLAILAHRKRWRLGVDVMLGGVAAWIAAKVVKTLVERPRPAGLIENVNRFAGSEGLGFVSGHTAVAAAIAAAASPYLPRPARRALWLLPGMVGLARIFYGAHLPLDIVGGAALGWGVGSVLHLVFGAPHRRPGVAEAASAVRAAGLDATEVRPVESQALGSFPFSARIGDELRFLKLLDPEPRDRDWLYRGARFLAFRDVRDEAAVADHETHAHREAAMALLARCHGANVPAVLGVVRNHSQVWIIEEFVEGTSLSDLTGDAVSDDILRGVWDQLLALRSARVSHRDLVGSNILVTGVGEVWFVDFAHAKTSTRGRTLDNDVAELLLTLALVVGPHRAVESAKSALGVEALSGALVELQPYVLTAENRKRARRAGNLLDDVRDAVSTQVGGCGDATRGDERQLARASVWLGAVLPSIAAMAGVLAIAGATDVIDVLSTPGYRWFGLAVASVIAASAAASVGLLATVDRRLAVGRTQLAVAHAHGRAILRGARDGRDVLVGYLNRTGLPASEGEEAVRRWSRSRVLVVGLALLVSGIGMLIDDTPTEIPSDASRFLVLAAVVTALSLPRRQVEDAPRSRSRGSFGATTGNWPMRWAAGLVEVGASVAAGVAVVNSMGGGAPVASVVLVVVVALVVELLVPIRLGTSLVTVLIAMGWTSVGVPVAAAAAAAILYELIAVWAPLALAALVKRVSPWAI